ncbi:MAG: hypothetical protein ACI9OJ_000748 [Myxococcota bacterium]
MLDGDAPAYQAFYCEENVWHLGRRLAPVVGYAGVLVISGFGKRVALCAQRAGRPGDGLLAWDYHVVLITGSSRLSADTLVWDFDHVPGFPAVLADWKQESFPPWFGVPVEFLPGFRLVDYEEYAALLSSDRSHMKDGDAWLQPPPTWPEIQRPGVENNVLRFADLSDSIGGEIVTLQDLICRSAESEPDAP